MTYWLSILFLQLRRAGLKCFTSRIWPTGSSLPMPDLHIKGSINSLINCRTDLIPWWQQSFQKNSTDFVWKNKTYLTENLNLWLKREVFLPTVVQHPLPILHRFNSSSKPNYYPHLSYPSLALCGDECKKRLLTFYFFQDVKISPRRTC